MAMGGVSLLAIGTILGHKTASMTKRYSRFQKEKWAGSGLVLAAAGLAGHTGALILRTVVSRHAPFTNMYESLSFLAWATVLALIVLDRKIRIPRVAPYMMLIAVGLLLNLRVWRE